MARIDDKIKSEILARTDIGTFIGSYVSLTKRGRDLVGLCPFHGEKSPSFHVHPDRGFFKCFGCQKSGDAITFAMEFESLTFPDALRVLGKRVGIELEEESSDAARVRGLKEQIYAANELAAAFFHRTLRFSPEAKIARDYAEKRGLTAATIEAFKLGYSFPGWDGHLVRELGANGHDLAVAEEAGLVKMGQRGYYDFYRGRFMIPTYATTGEVVAFGGRALDDSQPKYMNTSTTPVYTKGRGLYALSVARRSAAAKESLIVVEGYLDCIALHQAGFANAVASLGTAFTPEQAAELRKYAERVFLCFDADAAGGAATVKSIDVLNAAGCTAFIVQLPPGEDPDTTIRSHGAAAFSARLEAALPWIQFALDRKIDEIKEKKLARALAAREAEILVQTTPREEWDRWRVYTAQRLDLAANDLRSTRFLSNAANFAPRPGAASTMTRYAPAAEPPSADREIVAALLEEPSLVAEYLETLPLEVFRESRYREIYRVLRVHAARLSTTSDVLAVFSDERETVQLLADLQKRDRSSKVRFQDSAARRAHLDRVVVGFSEERSKVRHRELDRKIDEAFSSGAHVSQEERDEHRLLGEEIERRKRKRLGTK